MTSPKSARQGSHGQISHHGLLEAKIAFGKYLLIKSSSLYHRSTLPY